MNTLSELLAEHEAIGWVSDSAGDRGWTCLCGADVGLPPEHYAHLAAAVLAWIDERLDDADVAEGVCEAIALVTGDVDNGETTAALTAIKAVLRGDT